MIRADGQRDRLARLGGVEQRGDKFERPAGIGERHGEGSPGLQRVGEIGELLARDDLCRLRDRPLLLVNTYYRVLAIATGPSSPPSQLKASTVFAFENDSVTEVLPIEDGQPTLRTLALVSANDRSDKDVTK